MRILGYKDIDRAEWSGLVASSATGTWFQSPDAYDFYASQPEFYFVNYIDDVAKLNDPVQNSCEKKIVMLKANIGAVGGNAFVRKLSRFMRMLLSQVLHLPLGVYRYEKVRQLLSGPIFAEENVIPTLLPNWDNTPRRAEGAMVLHNATPEQFYLHCKETFAYVRGKQNKVVFLKSWNE